MGRPGHCLVFNAHERSYKELASSRVAEFGVLDRNQAIAEWSVEWLMRVRRFVQDDAFIVCMPDQVINYLHPSPMIADQHLARSNPKSRVSSTCPNLSTNEFIGENGVWDKVKGPSKTVFSRDFPEIWKLVVGDGAVS